MLCDAGNVQDAIFIAARAALWDLRIPVTRSVEFKSTGKEGAGMDTFADIVSNKVVDFELTDYWGDGEVLKGREDLPVCLTLNIVRMFPSSDVSIQQPTTEAA